MLNSSAYKTTITYHSWLPQQTMLKMAITKRARKLSSTGQLILLRNIESDATCLTSMLYWTPVEYLVLDEPWTRIFGCVCVWCAAPNPTKMATKSDVSLGPWNAITVASTVLAILWCKHYCTPCQRQIADKRKALSAEKSSSSMQRPRVTRKSNNEQNDDSEADKKITD